MKLKRFIATTTHQALQAIRKELGPDAVVLSSQSNEVIEYAIALAEQFNPVVEEKQLVAAFAGGKVNVD